jgi:hypoxanthine phosphoribosyltransferase
MAATAVEAKAEGDEEANAEPTPGGKAGTAPGAASGALTRKQKTERPVFAHPSEAEFARILDFYMVPWQYEPRSFALRSDETGRVVERFAPDFYLPDWDLYIELTTLRQSLVTKKNRKLRRLRELYPEINIKLLYRRDFHNLMRKFGLKPEEARA